MRRNKKAIFRLILFIIVLIVIILITVKAVDLKRTFELISAFPMFFILKLAVLSLFLALFKALRFHIMIKETSSKISVWQSIKIYFAGQAISPLPGGAAARLLLIKKEAGTSYTDSAGSLIAISFMEFLSALVVVLLGSFLLHLLVIPAIITTIVMVIIGFIILNHKLFRSFVSKIDKLKDLKGREDVLLDTMEGARDNIISESGWPKPSFLKAFLIAILSHILGGFFVYLIISQLGANLDIIKSIFAYVSSIVLATATGIIPAGIGTTEGGLTGMLVVNGILLSTAVAAVIIFRALTLGLYVISGFIFLAVFYRSILFKHEK